MGQELFFKGKGSNGIEIIFNLKQVTTIRKTRYESNVPTEGGIRFIFENDNEDELIFESEKKRDEVFERIWGILKKANYAMEGDW